MTAMNVRTHCRFYGVSSFVLSFVLLCLILVGSSAQAQTFTVLHTFTGGGDGAAPNGVIIDRGGNLYGTAVYGGSGNCANGGCGTVFKLTQRNSAWTFATLHQFQGSTDGGYPSVVTIGPDGSLFGAAGGYGVNGGGAIFNLKPPPTFCASAQCPWTERTLYAFPAAQNDGEGPSGPVVFDTHGNLYGSTFNGGMSCSFESGCGAVFELTPAQGQWIESRLYAFSPGTEPHNPVGIDLDAAGNVIGVSNDGGANDGGAVFKLTSTDNGWTNETLLSFSDSDQGAFPEAGATVHNGNIFGTTGGYGPLNGGTVWELVCCSWNFDLLYSFSYGSPAEAVGPSSPLIFDAAGNIYGTTNFLGAYGHGNVFKLTPTGGGNYIYSSLYDFTGGADGSVPGYAMAIDGNGNLYGTAQYGGSGFFSCVSGCGTAWEITQ